MAGGFDDHNVRSIICLNVTLTAAIPAVRHAALRATLSIAANANMIFGRRFVRITTCVTFKEMNVNRLAAAVLNKKAVHNTYLTRESGNTKSC